MDACSSVAQSPAQLKLARQAAVMDPAVVQRCSRCLSSVVEQGHERGAYRRWGLNAQAELQSNLKELDRILANLEEDLQELHTTPATAKGEPHQLETITPLARRGADTQAGCVVVCAETRKALSGVRMPGVPSATDAAAEPVAPPPPPPPSAAAPQSHQPDRVSHSIVVTGEEEAAAEEGEGELVDDQV